MSKIKELFFTEYKRQGEIYLARYRCQVYEIN